MNAFIFRFLRLAASHGDLKPLYVRLCVRPRLSIFWRKGSPKISKGGQALVRRYPGRLASCRAASLLMERSMRSTCGQSFRQLCFPDPLSQFVQFG
jgi:hypothetical protein